MRVLHVTSALDPVAGGIATAVARLAESQADAGLTVRIFSTWVSTPGNDAAEQLRQRGVHVQLLQCRDPRSHHRDLPRLVSDEIQNVDLVHVHGMWEEVQYHAGRIALGSHRPYVMTPHGMIAPWCMKKSNIPKRIYLRLRMRKNLNAASAIHYTSDAERDLCASLNLSAPTLVEPNGLDLSEFKSLPARGEFRRRRPEIGQRPVVLSLGRLSHKKGLDLLIPAFARANIPDALLVLAGPDEDGYQRQLESLAADNGIGDRVIFTGMLRGSERIAALVDADLFVLPSYQENFGIVVAEAMAVGCAVIISDQVNIYSDVITADAGAVVPCEIAPIADSLSQWMRDPARRFAAGQRGRAAAFERYDSSRIAARWADHYAKMIRASP